MLPMPLESGDVAPQRSPTSVDRTIPQGIVRLLPPSAFRSRLFQAEEDAAIWTRTWVCAGFAAEIPNAGDVLPFTVGNHGVHIERLANGSLVGRFNKAQHGGCRTVPLQCQTGAKTKCSFTACGYSRDRRPIAADDANRGASLDQYLGLRPERLLTVPVRTWGPLVLVRLDPEARSVFDWPSADDVLSVPASAEGGGAMATRWIEYDANWKHIAASLADGAIETAGPSHALGDGETALLYPNVVVLSGSSVTAAIILQPTALARTLCRIRLFARKTSTLRDESACDEILATIATRAAVAESRQRDTAGNTATPMRIWFEGKVAAATDALHDETQTAPLYQTQDKGGW
jgi:hypothetical protein